jgi:hypothetical protein
VRDADSDESNHESQDAACIARGPVNVLSAAVSEMNTQ